LTTAQPNPIAQTARWTAAYRATETERPDALFRDPWARQLAGDEVLAWREKQDPNAGVYIVMRTRFFDDFLLQVTQEQNVRQVVILAAGYDTRAYRLAWPQGTRMFEIDQPAVIEEKNTILTCAGAAPQCWRKAIGANLEEPWADILIEAGFDQARPTVWLLEGFLVYLPEAAANHMIDTLTSLSAAGSWLGLDIANQAMLKSRWTSEAMQQLAQSGTPWQFALDEPEAWLLKQGWEAEVTQPAEMESYGRWSYPNVPRAVPDIPRYFFVTAQRV
jgi:methyltransferase (TIGR00027 family)